MKDHKQYHPFNDFKPPKIWLDSQGAELPWREVAKRMREMPYEKDSEMLSYLTDVYRSELKDGGETKALQKFWQEVGKMRSVGFLTDDMEKTLLEAKAENIEAVQVMVRANPVTIHLPFVAQVMRYVVSQYKYCDAGVGVLPEVRKSWNKFLPSRSGGDVTYSNSDIERLFTMARKQIAENQERTLDRRMRQNLPLLEDVRRAVAEELNISEEYIRKNIKTETEKGGPNK